MRFECRMLSYINQEQQPRQQHQQPQQTTPRSKQQTANNDSTTTITTTTRNNIGHHTLIIARETREASSTSTGYCIRISAITAPAACGNIKFKRETEMQDVAFVFEAQSKTHLDNVLRREKLTGPPVTIYHVDDTIISRQQQRAR